MTFDYELLTIGAGSGGVAATRRAGNYGVRAAICEEDRVGGTCVLRGCIPKKLFVYASHFSEDFKDSKNYGWSVSDVTFDWETLVRNKDAELERLHGIYNKMLDDASFFASQSIETDYFLVTSNYNVHLLRPIIENQLREKPT